MEEKSNKGLKVLVVILIILLLGAIGYICYDKGVFDGLLGREQTVEEPKQDEDSFDKESIGGQINTYINQIPVVYPASLTNIEDAYSGKLMTLDDIDSSILLSYAVNGLTEDQLLSYEDGMPLPDGASSDSSIYIKASDMNEIIKKRYNYEIKDHKDFIAYVPTSAPEYLLKLYSECFTYKNGYYVSVAKYSKSMNKTYSKVLDYDVKNGVLTIKEKWGVSNCLDMGCYLYNKHYYLPENKLYGGNGQTDGNFNTYFEQNQDKFNTYKHTFKKADDGNYYWYSSEIMNE